MPGVQQWRRVTWFLPPKSLCHIGRDPRRDGDPWVAPWRISWRWPVDRGGEDEECPGELRAQARGGCSACSVPEQCSCCAVRERGNREAGKTREPHVLGRPSGWSLSEDHWYVDKGLYAVDDGNGLHIWPCWAWIGRARLKTHSWAVQPGSCEPQVAVQHLKCGRCGRGTGFEILFNFN